MYKTKKAGLYGHISDLMKILHSEVKSGRRFISVKSRRISGASVLLHLVYMGDLESGAGFLMVVG
jgi:bifunctional N-acetylglucosamine-1-phosphate-uridyltransferase/glucosamine-1-phosphate-acetyltransferase GlmU-like protein